MTRNVLSFEFPITLLGGGPVDPDALGLALRHAPHVVAADSGADRALENKVIPEFVIGDLDSISEKARLALASKQLIHIAEQATTDFDKCLRSVAAPFFLALGFSGGRLDHTLAAFNVLVRNPNHRCILIGSDDIVFAAPPVLALDLPVGLRFSLFPMAQITGKSRGLRWPIDGLTLAPDQRVGTSNQVSAPKVGLTFDRAGMLVILPRAALPAAISALGHAP